MIEVIFAVTTTRWGQKTVGIRKSSRLLVLAAALSGTLTAVPTAGHAAPALPNVGVPATMFDKYEYAAGDTAAVRVRTPDAYWHDPVTNADVRATEHGRLFFELYPRV